MREIREVIFRGKRTDCGEWVEGDLLHYESGEMAICKGFSKYGYEATEIIGRYKVIPETVGQYTGLTDKNGKRIFEGDILKSTIKFIDCNDEGYSILHHDIEDIGIVEWRKHGVMIAHKSGTWARCFYGCENYVIGNIHDNPELLQKI